MSNVTKLHNWVEATLDEMEFSRLQRAQEIAVMDQEANAARIGAFNSVNYVADDIAKLAGLPLRADDALVLVHSVARVLQKIGNQHLLLWQQVSSELEGVMAALLEDIEDERSERE